MPLIYDIKNKQNVRLKADTVYELFEMPGSGYMPLPNWKYTVQDPDTGDMEEVLGDKVRQRVRAGYILHDTQEQRLRNLARSQGSPLSQFGKQFLDEALSGGIYGTLSKKRPKNEVEAMYEKYFQDEFKTSRSIGQISGLILPYLMGGILGGVAKKATTKTISKLLKALPSAQALKAIDKLGQAGAKTAQKTAQKLGVKNRTALKLIGGGGKAIGWAAGDTALFATKRGLKAGFDENTTYDRSFDIRKALAETKNASKEIFTSSFLFGGGLLFTGSTIGTVARTTGRIAGKTGKWTSAKVKEADLANFFRAEFFNTPNSQQVMGVIKKRLSYTHRFLRDYIGKATLKNIYNNIPDSIKRAKKIKPDDFSKVISNASEKDIINVSTRVLKSFNNGKLPRTRKEVYDIMENLKNNNSYQIQIGRESILNKYSHVLKDIQKQKAQFAGRKGPFISLVKSMPQIFQNNLDEIAKMKMMPKSYWQKRKLDKSQFFKHSSLDDDMKNFYKAVFSLKGEKEITKFAKGIKDPKKQLDTFMKWIVYHTAEMPTIKKMSDLLKKERERELFAKWKKMGLNQKVIPVMRNQLKVMLDLRKSDFQEYFDFSKMNVLTNASKLNYDQIKTLRTMFRRYLESPSDIAKYDAHINNLSKAFDDLMPGALYARADEAYEIVSRAKQAVSDISKLGGNRQFVSKAERLGALLASKKRLNIFDVNETMKLLGELGNFAKANPTETQISFRKLYSKFSNLEDTLLTRAEKSNLISPFNAKNIIESKGKYSLSNLFLEIFDKPVRNISRGGNPNFRDLFFMAGGGIGGGAALLAGNPIIGIAAFGASWAASKGVAASMARGAYFLNMADKIDSFSSFVRKQNNVYNRFKDRTKLSNFVRSPGELRGLNVNLATISYLFFGQPSDSFEGFYDKLQEKDPVDTFSDTQGDIVSMLENIGGEESAQDANRGIVDLKQAIMGAMPKPKINPVTGKRMFSTLDKNKFFYTIGGFASPANFLNSFKAGTLSRRQAQVFSRLFPDHYNSLVISVVEALRDKEQNWPLPVYRSIDILTQSENKGWLYHFDMVKKEKREEMAKNIREGGLKFDKLNQPMQSQRIGGGQI